MHTATCCLIKDKSSRPLRNKRLTRNISQARYRAEETMKSRKRGLHQHSTKEVAVEPRVHQNSLSFNTDVQQHEQQKLTLKTPKSTAMRTWPCSMTCSMSAMQRLQRSAAARCSSVGSPSSPGPASAAACSSLSVQLLHGNTFPPLLLICSPQLTSCCGHRQIPCSFVYHYMKKVSICSGLVFSACVCLRVLHHMTLHARGAQIDPIML